MCQEGIEDLFPLYHNCTEKPKIYHGNGGAEIPLDDDDVAGAEDRHDIDGLVEGGVDDGQGPML
jgi:hypothetical protein